MTRSRIVFVIVLVLAFGTIAGTMMTATVGPASVHGADTNGFYQYMPLVMNPTMATPTPTSTPTPAPSWSPIVKEFFEGAFPRGSWDVFDNNGPAYGEFYWDEDDYKPYGGAMSAWPANGGADGLDPQAYYYPDDLDSWMVYGPFSLADALDAELRFWWWLDSEYGYDWLFWGASVNGDNFYGTGMSGYSSGWLFENFDLTSVQTLGDLRGESQVWIAFIFESDVISIGGYDGAFVDNIVLRKQTIGGEAPAGLAEEMVSSELPSTLVVDTEAAVGIHDEMERPSRSPRPIEEEAEQDEKR